MVSLLLIFENFLQMSCYYQTAWSVTLQVVSAGILSCVVSMSRCKWRRIGCVNYNIFLHHATWVMHFIPYDYFMRRPQCVIEWPVCLRACVFWMQCLSDDCSACQICCLFSWSEWMWNVLYCNQSMYHLLSCANHKRYHVFISETLSTNDSLMVITTRWQISISVCLSMVCVDFNFFFLFFFFFLE